MRRIGMTRDPADDFEDPSVPEGPLRQCVLYRPPAEMRTAYTARQDATLGTAPTLHERAAPTPR